MVFEIYGSFVDLTLMSDI